MDWPDTVPLLVSYLDGVSASDVKVATRVPDPRPAKLVQLRLVGGQKLPPVRATARVDIFTWGADVTDETGALALGLDVRGYINALIGTSLLGIPVYRVEETLSLRQLDDPSTGVPRGWATYSILHRADGAIR